jgi:anthranilate phosphoribosyltransferase
MFRDYLKLIIQRQDLSESQMTDMMNIVLTGQATEAQIGAMMAALATKGETFEELAGAAKAMRQNARRIQAVGTPSTSPPPRPLWWPAAGSSWPSTATAACRASAAAPMYWKPWA